MEKENMDLNMRDHVEDESAVSCSLNYSTEGQVNLSSLGFPELRWDFGKINTQLPSVVNIKQPEVSRGSINTQESCSCSSRLVFHDHINVINTDRAIAPICVDIAEVNSDSLHILCKTDALSRIPVKTTSYRYTFKSLRQGRRTRSVSNLSDSIAERSLAVLSGNVGTSPSAKWMHQPTNISSKGRAFTRGELFSTVLKADTIKEQDESISALRRDGESLELLTFPSRNFCLLTENPKLSIVPFIRRKSDAGISRQLLFSYSSTYSAIIRCVWKSNVPCFLFSSDDGQGVYMARPLKVKCSTSEDLDFIYLFHSWDNNRKTSKNQLTTASDIVGKMKVSSSLYVDSNRSKSMETEFVLFASNYEHVSEKQKSSSFTKTGGISGKVAEMFRSSHSSNYNSIQKINASDSHFDDKLHIFAPDICISEETGTLASIVDELSPNLEVAAIVVKANEYDSIKIADFSGWGLKFLEKVEADNYNSQTRLSPSDTSKGECIQNVNVLVPTGLHGGPAGRNGCPSSLLERWRSNGHCDCGGWDIGCPLKILTDASSFSKVSPKQELEEDFKPLQLFLECGKQCKPQFELLSLTDDMYAMHFQSTLSDLQSFAVAVAIIHSRTPDLYTKL